jgi:AsmA protein
MVKWLGIAAAALVLLAVTAVVALPYFVRTPRIKALVSHSASQALGRPVRFSSLSIRVLPLPAVKLKDLEVGEDPTFGTKPFLTIGEGSLRLKILPLLSRRMEFGELVLERPKVALIQDASGRLNVASLGAHSSSAPPARPGPARSGVGGAAVPVVSRVKIVDGAVTFVSRGAAGRSAYRLEDVNLTLEGLGPGSPIRFAGNLRLDPGSVALKISDGSVGLGGARSVSDALIRTRLQIDAKSIAELVAAAIGSIPQLAGSATGSFALTGTVGEPRVSGQIELPRLAVAQTQPECPPPQRRTLTLERVRLPISFANSLLTSQPFSTKLGGGTMTAGVSWSPGDGGLLRLKNITIRTLSLEPVLVNFLCQGYAVTGPLDLTGELTARPSDVLGTLSGAGQLKIGPGKVVGPQALKLLGGVVRVSGAVASLLSVDLPTSVFSSPLDFDSIAATYTITNGVVRTSDLRYVSQRLQVNAAGQYGLADKQMSVQLVMHTGRGEIAAKVSGAASSPSIRVDPTALVQHKGLQRGVKGLEQDVRDLLRRLR